MSRVYRERLKCGCMFSDDGGGGMIPCSAGYWDMTPEEFRGPQPENYDLHEKCMQEYHSNPDEGVVNDFLNSL